MITINSKDRRFEDWKNNLCVEAEQELNAILESIRKHRCAYKSAESVEIAQVWCALIEQMRMINKLEQRVTYIERVLDKLFKGHSEEREKLLEGLFKF